MATWRCEARAAIEKAVTEGKAAGRTGDDLEKYVRAFGYPFGERAMHPYKIWCSEMKKFFPKRKKCEPIDLTDHPFLLTGERTT